MVCGAPFALFEDGCRVAHCAFRKAESLSDVRGSVQLLVSRTVLAVSDQSKASSAESYQRTWNEPVFQLD